MFAPLPKRVAAGCFIAALALAAVLLVADFPRASTDQADPDLIDQSRSSALRADRTGADRYRTEKSKRTKIEGYADLYAAYHEHIRTAPGAVGTTYPANYRINELTRARALRKSAAAPLPWVERGPGNVSGRTRAIVVDPDDRTHRIWIAGSVSGGLWKTTDAGDTWNELAPDLPNLAISSLAQAPSDPDVIYAGTGEGFFSIDHVAGDGIFKSSDRGASWTQLAATAANPEFRYVNRLIIDPNDESVVLAATGSGIYRSQDGGSTWNRVYASEAGPTASFGSVQDLASQPGNFQVQLAGINARGIARSTDGGRTWTLIDNAIVGPVARVELAFAPSDPDRAYAAVEQGGESGLHMSTNGGLTWAPVLETSEFNNADWLGAQGWYDNSIAVHPFSADTVFVGGIDLWKIGVNELTREVEGVTSVDEDNTGGFLDFIDFAAPYFDGALQTGDNEGAIGITDTDFVTVELRFGPDRGQRAHRFIPNDGPGIPLNTYEFADYAHVPFEAWDTVNDRQLMVSFRDRLHDGEFDLTLRDAANLGREYIFVHAVPYEAEQPHPLIARDGGPVYRLLYFTWPILAAGGAWDAANLPESILRINYDSYTARLRSTRRIDARSAVGERVHVDHHNITIIPIDASTNAYKIVNGNDGGIYRSLDSGRTWDKASGGFNTTQFYGVDRKPGVGVYAGGTQDNGTWVSFGNPGASSNWIHRIGGDGFDVEWHDENPDLILGSVYFNYIQRSENGGVSFEDAYIPSGAASGLADNGPDRAPFITQLAATPANPDLVFALGSSGVWKSEDFGLTWTLSPLPQTEWGLHSGGKAAVSPINADIVWAGFYMDPTQRLHVSTDGGSTFVPTATSPLSPGVISGLAADPHDENTAYVMFSAYGRAKILRTRDLGQSWTDLSGFGQGAESSDNGFPNVAVYDLLVLPDRSGELWAATEIGLFISYDDGASWQYADNGLPAVSIWEMRIVEGEIVLATHGRGVWTLPLSAVTPVSHEALAELPGDFALAPNYPNPFNPATTIIFDVPVATHVRISIYDVAGRRVASLVDAPYAPGRHEAVWDARGVASGLYFYRLESPDFEATRSMMVLR